MDNFIRPIAVVDCVSGAAVQELFCALTERWRPALRLVGVIAESHGLADRTCSAGYLRRLGTDQRFAIFEDQGPGATACHLDSSGVLAAADAVCQDIATGCDLVVLNKFGRLEAGGKGLYGAFKAAAACTVPLLTSVSPAVADAWKRFAAPGFVALPADATAVESWARAVLCERYRGPALPLSASGATPSW